MSKGQTQAVYDESKIKTLSSLEHIRLRTGMYIGRLGNGSNPDDGIYILLKEVVDNAIDEFIMGHGKRVLIHLEDNHVTVRDYGRGIPLGKVVECVSVINTGAKYNDDVFQFTVGLNGIGTKAVKEPAFVAEACSAFPGKVIVGLDAKDGLVATDGWAEVSEVRATELAKRFESDGVSAIVYTDIARDGMMQGVNVEATVAMARASSIPVIASGGITDLDDIRALSAVAGEGICGAITGRAIYEGTLDVAEAQRICDEAA